MSSSADSSQVQSIDPRIALSTRVGPPFSYTPLSQASAHSPISPNATLSPPGAAQLTSYPITILDQDHASSQIHAEPFILGFPSLNQPSASSHPDLPSHPMTTRSKNHISKPKSFIDGPVRYPLPPALRAGGVDVAVLAEPTCYTSARILNGVLQ